MDKIYFTVNGESYSLSGSEVSPNTSLNDYIRNYLHLYGTKAMCHEGGCGACVVSVTQTHPVTKEKHMFSVNSCLVHVLSCHQWDILTVEGLGNRKDGYHPIQSRLAMFNGTQCGYCTPGWVMSMHSMYEGSNQKLTMREVENSFAGNMCRCTGYRPILDAFKSFATDTSDAIKGKLEDLEDLHKIKCKRNCSKPCNGVSKCDDDDKDDWCLIESTTDQLMTLNLDEDGTRWYKAFTVEDVFKVLKENTAEYRLVAGNTGQGVYWITNSPRVFIDISSIASLKESMIDNNLVLGAGMTLSDAMKQFQHWAAKNKDFKYLNTFFDHLDLVAHYPVRNVGTIGGNLAMKNAHNDFASDVFVLLATVKATVTIMDSSLKKTDVDMQSFLNVDLRNKLIVDVKLPPLSARNFVRTYKIMPRAQNAHAIVNAGFLFTVNSSSVVEACDIVYGSIGAAFIRANATENILRGSNLYTNETLLKALKALKDEVNPEDVPPEPSPNCKRNIALGLFYKAVLSLCPDVSPRYKSGGEALPRAVSRGEQNFDTDKTMWPVNKPIPKLEGLPQCAGEAKYALDVPKHREVHLAFVLSDVAKAEIISFDATEALKLPGVVAFYTAKDIPGKNTFIPSKVPWLFYEEEILATKVSYHGQPVGLIAAVNHKLANRAARLVRVHYKQSSDKLVMSIAEALVAKDKDQRVLSAVRVEPTSRGDDTTHVIKGTFSAPPQYHYTMETQSCVVAHSDQGLVVRAATQWLDLITNSVATALGITQNKVHVEVDQIGGGYGGKASRSAWVACAAAVAAHNLGRTASFTLPLTHNMAAIGKRQECYVEYEVRVNDAGVIQYANVTYYSDCGHALNDTSGADIAGVLAGLYATSRWRIHGYNVLTDKAGNTWCRAPGSTEGHAMAEHIMERIAFATKKDPVEVRLLNINPSIAHISDLITTLKTDSNYERRKADIATFNAENAWKKRGLKLSIMTFPIGFMMNYPITISVYHGDGTICISHGGIEMGQGIHTKVAQACAYTLKVPIEKIYVRGSNSFVAPNSIATAGSVTSEAMAYATIRASEELMKRLQPVRDELNEPTWEEVVDAAYDKGINLQSTYMGSALDNPSGYNICGVCALEVELDALTGNYTILRVDLIEDTGLSMNPDIDIGQIEGAFMMGLGMWTSESLTWSSSTGRLLTDRTWTYKPPGVKDIPVDFRVTFQRNSSNTAGVLRSKATGEPALCLSVVVTFALHDAVREARNEFGYNHADWAPLDSPCTVENIIKAINMNIESFKLK